MSKPKYKQIFETIWNENKILFQKFLLLNNDYSDTKKRKSLEEKFQTIGKQVRDLLLEGEQDLCRQMEKSEHRFYSSNLSEKYWDEVRRYFKYIDQVGVVTKRI